MPCLLTDEAGTIPPYKERAVQECCGVLPLAQIREPYSAVRFLAEHLPLEHMYGLKMESVSGGWSETKHSVPCAPVVVAHTTCARVQMACLGG